MAHHQTGDYLELLAVRDPAVVSAPSISFA